MGHRYDTSNGTPYRGRYPWKREAVDGDPVLDSEHRGKIDDDVATTLASIALALDGGGPGDEDERDDPAPDADPGDIVPRNPGE